jgi:hypothetical protein
MSSDEKLIRGLIAFGSFVTGLLLGALVCLNALLSALPEALIQ